VVLWNMELSLALRQRRATLPRGPPNTGDKLRSSEVD
jgi:hypothetical protein